MEITVAHQHPAALEPLLHEALRFDDKDYHESQGVPLFTARALGSVCRAWRAAIAALGGACFLLKETERAWCTKRRRRIDLVDYFDHFLVTFVASGRERKTIADWVNLRLRAIRAHLTDLDRTRQALKVGVAYRALTADGVKMDTVRRTIGPVKDG